MMAELTTWLEKTAKSLLQKPPSDDEPPNDRLPSEQRIGHYALRGYRGPAVMVAASRYFAGTVKLSSFSAQHAHNMESRKWPVSRDLVERDLLALEELAELNDAVTVVPAY